MSAGVADRFVQLCADKGLPTTRLGETGGDALEVLGVLSVDLPELRAAHESTLPALFGPLAGASAAAPAAPALG